MIIGILGGLVSATALGLAAADDAAGRVAAAVVAAQSTISRLEFDCLLSSREAKGGTMTDRYHEALAPGRRFAETIHLNSRNSDPWLDPYRNRAWGRPDGTTVLRVFERSVRSYGPDSTEALRSSPYTDCIGWRPPGEPARPTTARQARFFLLDVFDPAEVPSLRVRPDEETVDGLRCVVVEAAGGRDTLWICPERGHALVRRVIRRDAPDEEIEYRAREFREVDKGSWLPTYCEGTIRDPKGGSATATRSFQIEARHLAVNRAVPDDLFQPHFPPGTLVFGNDGRLEQSVAGGAELLDLWVAVAVSLVPPSGQPVSPRSGAVMMYLFGGVLLAWGAWLMLLASTREAAIEALAVEASTR